MANVNTVVGGRVYVDGGFRCCVGTVGPKWAHLVILTDGDQAVVRRITAKDARLIRPLVGYPVLTKLAKRLLRGRRSSNMTKRAKNILTEASS